VLTSHRLAVRAIARVRLPRTWHGSGR
jgi:hypothetical protein